MNENLDLFISTYKSFDKKPISNVYKIIDGDEEKITNTNLLVYHDNNGDNISHLNKHYNEYSRIYWVWKNYAKKDYVGFCSYRRYFNFFNNVPNMDELFKTKKIVLPIPATSIKNNLFENYGSFHNKADLLYVSLCVLKLYPEYKDDLIKTFGGKKLYTNGLFIMKKEDFNNFCEFIFSIFKHYDELMKFKTHNDVVKRVTDNKEQYLKNYEPNSTIEYQSRIHGYLAERLLTLWVNHNFKEEEIQTYKILKTENKY